jgi:hypothetical protein
MNLLRLLLLVSLLAAVGCWNSSSRAPSSSPEQTGTDEAKGDMLARAQDLRQKGLEDAKKDDQPKGKDGNNPPARLPRKTIYTGEVTLVVNDFDGAIQGLKKLVDEQQGEIEHSQITGYSGGRRSAHWTVRIPPDHFRPFMDAVVNLGIPEINKTDSRDVTAQFYDLQSRIKNKKVEEERLLDHLKKSTGKLDEILSVEKALSRVREEVESMETSLRVMNDQIELTTVTITLRDAKDYVPPQAVTFSGRLGNTFRGSWDALVGFGQGLVLFVVALTPWLPVIALALVPAWVLYRRSRRTPPAAEPIAAQPVEPTPS